MLKKRFGLGQGFAVYDDEMPAADMGAGGEAERRAGEVVDRAVSWLEGQIGQAVLPVGARVRSAPAL